MIYLILITRFFIKLFANTTKVLSYVFIAFAPNYRFKLKSFSPALRQSVDQSHMVPRIIWQTNFTDRVTLPVYLNYRFNRLMSPTFEHRFVSTEAREDFIRSNYSERVINAYSRIQIGAAQADFWRVLVLYKCGGVYMDIDAHLIWPLEKMAELKDGEIFIQIKSGDLSNYFMASKPDTKNLELVINQIVENIENDASENVYDLTGPGVITRVLSGRTISKRFYLYTCNQGNFTNEFFQYIDKPQGKWTKEQQKIPVLKPKAAAKR